MFISMQLALHTTCSEALAAASTGHTAKEMSTQGADDDIPSGFVKQICICGRKGIHCFDCKMAMAFI